MARHRALLNRAWKLHWDSDSVLGFVVIVILYAVIGLIAASGVTLIARNIFTPKA